MTKEQLRFWNLVSVRLSVSIIIGGSLLRISHWTYAFHLISLGSMMLLLTYSIRFLLKDSKQIAEWIKLLFIILLCARTVIIMGHLPVYNMIWTVANILQGAALLYLYFSSNLPNIPPKSNSIGLQAMMGFSGLLIIAGCLFKIMHWPYAVEFLTIGSALLIGWLMCSPFLNKRNVRHLSTETILDDFEEDKPTITQKLKNAAVFKGFHLLALILVVIGLIFKLKHWPGSSVLIVFGLIIGTIDLFLTMKK